LLQYCCHSCRFWPPTQSNYFPSSGPKRKPNATRRRTRYTTDTQVSAATTPFGPVCARAAHRRHGHHHAPATKPRAGYNFTFLTTTCKKDKMVLFRPKPKPAPWKTDASAESVRFGRRKGTNKQDPPTAPTGVPGEADHWRGWHLLDTTFHHVVILPNLHQVLDDQCGPRNQSLTPPPREWSDTPTGRRHQSMTAGMAHVTARMVHVTNLTPGSECQPYEQGHDVRGQLRRGPKGGGPPELPQRSPRREQLAKPGEHVADVQLGVRLRPHGERARGRWGCTSSIQATRSDSVKPPGFISTLEPMK
jgi:hypothetical protein